MNIVYKDVNVALFVNKISLINVYICICAINIRWKINKESSIWVHKGWLTKPDKYV